MMDAPFSPRASTHAGLENCRSSRYAHTSHSDGDEPTSLQAMLGIRHTHCRSASKRDRFRAALFSFPFSFRVLATKLSFELRPIRNIQEFGTCIERRPSARFAPGSIRADFRHPRACGSRAPSAL